ncbi:MAG: type II toxin-antitoxin system prevent-host-death family antitoxin [Candidatus Sulfotelmatobacter sp.]|jgi:prevent-host-death family protein
METITIHKAKTQLSRLIEKACRGEEIVIARGKKPVVKLVPVELPPKKRTLGLWKGLVSYTPDAFDPLTDQEMKDLGFE